MTDAWYELVDPATPLTQGDIILSCPLIGWKDEPIEGLSPDDLLQSAEASEADVVVMTQACDLQHRKVANVVLCTHVSLADYLGIWTAAREKAQENPTPKAWKRHCEYIRDGLIWNLTFLNSADLDGLQSEVRVVDFREVYTAPRDFLESVLRAQDQPRLRLLPPYREHLSQAFARFFMRVGLPVEVTQAW